MKTIGLIGGTGWVSTVEYYRQINEEINNRLGGMYSAKCLIHSFNFEEIISLQETGNAEAIYLKILAAAENLINSGADCIALCANTMHLYITQLKSNIAVPVVHIGEATALTIKRAGLSKVGLLGTKLTMEKDFYTGKLQEFGITTMVPDKEERDYIHSVIFDELIKDDFRKSSRSRFLEIIDSLKQEGAEGVILGCTEIPLLIHQDHTDIPLFNTLNIHANALVDFAVNEKQTKY